MVWEFMALGFKFSGGAFEDGFAGEGGEWGFFGGFPHDAIAADQCEGGVPCPNGDGKVEGGDHADRANRVPHFAHMMFGAFGLDGEAVELAGEANREVANVDHFLHFTETFGGDFAAFYCRECAEVGFGGAELFAEEADEFAADGSGCFALF